MKKIMLIILIFISFASYSQTEFEHGYVINNQNQKIACYILNEDWKNNPNKIDYKIDSLGSIFSQTIKTIKEFGINENVKFIRAIVKIDNSGELSDNIAHDKNPSWYEDTVFLKVLIEGKASLFYYEKSNLRRFFFSIDSLPIIQLIYKEYIGDDYKIHQNNAYLAQLRLNLICNDELRVRDVSYSRSALKKYFLDYNSCIGMNSVNFDSHYYSKFRLKATFGICSADLYVSNDSYDVNINFPQKYSFCFGMEAESVLPFNKGKWGIFLNPSFISYKAEGVNKNYQPYPVSKITYSSIDIPFGIKRYIFITESSKIYFDISYVMNFPLNSNFSNSYYYIKIKARNNIAIGLGYEYKRFYFDFQLNASRDILPPNYISSYQSTIFRIGYCIL